mmetsp:Transcript_39289/g.88303  ORF Transcript_39289/g.88303 Transcript_39289/m.88303 type:complete len:145 (-) Transcript_39289:49-483(-)
MSSAPIFRRLANGHWLLLRFYKLQQDYFERVDDILPLLECLEKELLHSQQLEVRLRGVAGVSQPLGWLHEEVADVYAIEAEGECRWRMRTAENQIMSTLRHFEAAYNELRRLYLRTDDEHFGKGESHVKTFRKMEEFIETLRLL